MKYKVGQRFTTNHNPSQFGGCVFEIYDIDVCGEFPYRVKIVKKQSCSKGRASIGYTTSWKDCGDMNIIRGKSTRMTSLKSVYKSIKRKEPEKSFHKAGIIDDNDDLTQEGEELFLGFLLEQNKDAFKKEVVDGIINEMESEKE